MIGAVKESLKPMRRSRRLGGMARTLASMVAAVVLALGMAMLPVHRAMACSCAELTDKQAMAAASVVFEGVVVREPNQILEGIVSSGDPVRFEFGVQDVLKGGSLPDRLEVETARSSPSCGAGFAQGERWRVFAHGTAPDHLSSHLCSGNRLLEEHAAIPPSTNGDGWPAPDPAAFVPIAIGAGLLLIVGLALVLFRAFLPR